MELVLGFGHRDIDCCSIVCKCEVFSVLKQMSASGAEAPYDLAY
jgi:hypothetical protein